jgi:hypothetical protein
VNWQAIGAVGEVLGGLLVVFSLLYLAVQLRQNTRALRADTHQQWVGMNSAQNLLFPQHPNFAKLFLKGSRNPEQLSPDEHLQVDGLILNVMITQEALFFQYREGAVDEAFLRGREPGLNAILSNRAAADWWDRNAAILLDPRFVAYVGEFREAPTAESGRAK